LLPEISQPVAFCILRHSVIMLIHNFHLHCAGILTIKKAKVKVKVKNLNLNLSLNLNLPCALRSEPSALSLLPSAILGTFVSIAPVY